MGFEQRWQLAGWAMFAVSGVFFSIAAVQARDWLGVGSAVTWLLGVAFFVVTAR